MRISFYVLIFTGWGETLACAIYANPAIAMKRPAKTKGGKSGQIRLLIADEV